jgi:hypothetical protein
VDSKDTGSRGISTNPIQTEDSFIANIRIRGIGNATESATFIITRDFDTKTTTSVGQGIITSSPSSLLQQKDKTKAKINSPLSFLFLLFSYLTLLAISSISQKVS